MAQHSPTPCVHTPSPVPARTLAAFCLLSALEALGAGALVLIAVLTVLHPDHPLAAFAGCVMEASR